MLLQSQNVLSAKQGRTELSLQQQVLQQGAHSTACTQKASPSCHGLTGSLWQGYEEVHVPAPKHKPFAKDERLIEISELPSWAQPAFPKMKSLNRIQSNVYQTAFNSADNVLMCAPTGAGKTNVAMLTMLHEVQTPTVREPKLT